jgi:predicted permease
MTTMFQDIRYAFRMLLKRPGVTAVAVATLALGMAGNTVIFSFLNAFFLRPMPFTEPDRLVDLDETAPRWNLEYTGLSYPDFHSWRQQNRSFDGMAAWQTHSCTLSFQGDAERVQGAWVTHDLLTVLGLRPALGRSFTPKEDRPGGERVAMVSRSLASRLFANEEVLGKVLHIDREPFTIVGILPEAKTLLEGAEVWMPLAKDPDDLTKGWYLRGVGRLKRGVTLAAARDDLLGIHRGLVENHRANENTFPKLTPITERMFGSTRPVLAVLMGAVGVVLLIACGNVAAIMLARGLARWQELSIRMSLGATPWRIARLIGMEGIMLSGLAGILGLCLGYWGLHALVNSLVDRPPGWISFTFDVRIWLYALVMVLATALCGILPTLHAIRVGHAPGTAQSPSRQSTTSNVRCRSLHSLVVAEVALTLILLVQAGLLVQAFRSLQRMDPGYRADHLLVYRIALPESQYKEKDAWHAFFRDHIEQIQALPGVTAASAVSAPPLGGHRGTFYTPENAPARRPDEPDPVVLLRVAWPGYFETLGITMLAGRTFTDQDGLTDGARAVIVNETFARRCWPNRDPIGMRIKDGGPGSKAPWMTVVGVARDVKHYGLDRPMIPGVYIPYAQDRQSVMAVVVRTTADPLDLMSSVRGIVRRTDPDLPVFEVETMAGLLHRSLWLRRLYSELIGVFAGVALVMALGGLYGVFSYVVNGRTREIGIRIAVGASTRTVLWMVLRQALILSAIGIAIGLVGTAITVPLMRGILLGVRASDAAIFALVPVFLIVVALLAGYIPARRAARIDPMAALRHE